jgi:hypothetical protein
VYYFPDPPYVLLALGLFASLTSGLAFDSVLKLSVKDWSKNRSTRRLSSMRGFQLLIPFVGIAIGACVFLCAGMEIFGFPTKLAYAIALPMTAFIGWLVWWQLGKTLAELDRGGSAALDLDSFES